MFGALAPRCKGGRALGCVTRFACAAPAASSCQLVPRPSAQLAARASGPACTSRPCPGRRPQRAHGAPNAHSAPGPHLVHIPQLLQLLLLLRQAGGQRLVQRGECGAACDATARRSAGQQLAGHVQRPAQAQRRDAVCGSDDRLGVRHRHRRSCCARRGTTGSRKRRRGRLAAAGCAACLAGAAPACCRLLEARHARSHQLEHPLHGPRVRIGHRLVMLP